MPKNIQLPKPEKYATAQAWCDACIEIFKKNKETFKDHIFLCDNFPPEYVSYYNLLQNTIPKCQIDGATPWLDEQNRPTIYLKVRGHRVAEKDKSGKSKFKSTYGYFGGVGPISDANALVGIIRKLTDQGDAGIEHYSADLFSCPPPRKSTSKITAAVNMASYKAKMDYFAQESGSQYYSVLSNTAHINVGVLEYMVGAKHFINLVDEIVDKMIEDYKADKSSVVLVLGTTQAATAKLYPSKLAKKGISAILPEQDKQNNQQAILQEIIDCTKKGISYNGKPPGEVFVEFVYGILENLDSAKRPLPTHFVLSCTEPPICLKALDSSLPLEEALSNPSDVSAEKILLARLKALAIKNQNPGLADAIGKMRVIDSEHIFVETIAHVHQKIEQQQHAPVAARKPSFVSSVMRSLSGDKGEKAKDRANPTFKKK